MIGISLKKYDASKPLIRNILYKIEENTIVPICEKHESTTERVNLEISLTKNQYAILGNEYRNPSVSKGGYKTADILTCIIDEEKKEIYSFIMDIKKDISAFSDNLLKDGAMITAIKEVRDFIKQIHDENLHKNSFMLYYRDEGYVEKMDVGIATKSFESNKFIAVADFLEGIDDFDKPSDMPALVWCKFKTNLMPYFSEIERLRDFANGQIHIGEKTYELKIFLLEKVNDTMCSTSVPLQLNCT